jgi:hypothetical protein
VLRELVSLDTVSLLKMFSFDSDLCAVCSARPTNKLEGWVEHRMASSGALLKAIIARQFLSYLRLPVMWFSAIPSRLAEEWPPCN